jgi:transcriptional antiterminator NusG
VQEVNLSENPEKKWYAVHVLSGHERKVKSQLENEADIAGLSDKIFQVLIPSEQITEMRDGKKRTRNKVFFPGYMLVEMVLDKETRHLILNTSGITSFVGPKNEPQPLRQDEVDRILGRVEESGEGEILDIPFSTGDPILVIDGPFTDFSGFVEEINEEKKKVKVRVSIFGRSTPVELDFLQVVPEK